MWYPKPSRARERHDGDLETFYLELSKYPWTLHDSRSRVDDWRNNMSVAFGWRLVSLSLYFSLALSLKIFVIPNQCTHNVLDIDVLSNHDEKLEMSVGHSQPLDTSQAPQYCLGWACLFFLSLMVSSGCDMIYSDPQITCMIADMPMRWAQHRWNVRRLLSHTFGHKITTHKNDLS